MAIKKSTKSLKKEFLRSLQRSLKAESLTSILGGPCVYPTTSWFKGVWYPEIPDMEFQVEIIKIIEKTGYEFIGIVTGQNARWTEQQADWKWDIMIGKQFEHPSFAKIRKLLPRRVSKVFITNREFAALLLLMDATCETVSFSNEYTESGYNPVFCILAYLNLEERLGLHSLIAHTLRRKPENTPWLSTGYEGEPLSMKALVKALCWFADIHCMP